MSAITRADSFVGEGKSRVLILGALAATAAIFLSLPHLPNEVGFNSWMAEKTPIIYVTVLTVQAAFLAAVLTIWTLMKTRASRYIERLADSASFAQFISAFEIRLVLGCTAVLATAIVTIGGWTLTADQNLSSTIVLIWAFVCVASTALLIDSLLTARVLL